MPSVTIEVTQTDIDEGAPGVCHSCPIALALARAFPGERWITVNGLSAAFCHGIHGLAYVTVDLPEAAREFVREFDVGFPVAPFTFTLEVPDALVAA